MLQELKIVVDKHPYTPKSKYLHPMDCNDIVIGSAKGDLHRVYDAYTRDRSTPQRDSFYGGSDDLTGAFAYEDEEGYTVIGFQKSLNNMEQSDQPIVSGIMHVIWAFGQEKGESEYSSLFFVQGQLYCPGQK